MSDQKNNRDKLLQLRLTAAEYSKLQAGFSVSASRRLNHYARSICWKSR